MFTVKQLSTLAGVTPRTLHYYDEIGLLKPSQVKDNGYRYYGDEALLRLQQILLYRELDLPLEEIRGILTRKDFNVLQALEQHREELGRRVRRIERLIATVDETIMYLKGLNAMSEKQLFAAFSDEEQAKLEQEAMQLYDPETVKESSRRWKSYSAAEKERIMAEGNAVYTDMIRVMPKGAASPEVQACVERWHKHMSYFWEPNDEQLVALAANYGADWRFKENFDKMHPDLADFMHAAVQVYVSKRKAVKK